MSDPNKLPAIPDPDGSTHTVVPYATSEYLVADWEGSIAIAPLTEAQRELLSRQTTSGRGDRVAIVSGTAVELGGALSHLPQAVALGVCAVGAAVVLGTTLGKPAYSLRVRGHQKREIQAAFSTPDAMSLPMRWIGADVPEELWDTSIEYPTGNELAQTHAHELLESVGTTAPGLRQHADTRKGQPYWQVSPGLLAKQAIEMVGEVNRDRYLRSTYASLIAMNDAAKLLPPQGLMPRTPNSMREHHLEPAKDLLFGALGAYAVMREMAGPIVAERVRFHYAQHHSANEELLEDIVHLDEPTKYGVTWATIEDFRDSVL